MSTDWALKTKGAAAPMAQKPGRTFARKRDQWIKERTPARRRALARHRLALRVAAAVKETDR